MTSILEKVKKYYEQKGISASNFHCPHYHECKSGCADFTKAREPFVGTKYDKGGKRKQPRILFVSLDSGKGDTLAKYRTAEQARQRSEHEWEYKKRDKNKHWFQTHALAWKFLKGFTLESPLTREIDSYFAKGKVVADALTITTHVREHVTPYFAHTNSARCSQNNSGKAQAHSRLFKNCRCYMAGELEALSPDIIVTQGAHAHTAVKYAIDQGNIVLVRDIRSSSKIYHHAILDIDGKQVLWFHTYHPRNYGKFFQQRKQCWDHWAQIAVEWYRQRR